MNLHATLASHLPYVRRYARALTGDQATGDNYVRTTLEALVEGDGPPRAFHQASMTARVALYHTFHSIWLSSGAKLEPREPASFVEGTHAHERLMRINPRSREAFLLTALEGFTLEETAQILGGDIANIESLIAEAQSEIDTELAADVLIIEDEPVIAADLEGLLTELGHRVSGVASTRTDAVAFALQNPPGLVLADIQLADGSSGVDAAQDILGHYALPVIVITAFPELLLTGEGPEPTFVITKPFQPGMVKAAIGQALFFHPGPARRTKAA